MSLTIGLVSFHTSPLIRPGTGDGGGLNVYVDALANGLAAEGHQVHVFTRRHDPDQAGVVYTDGGYTVHHIPAGPEGAKKEELDALVADFVQGILSHPVARTVDIWHGHYWLSGRAAAGLGGLFTRPVVQTFHTLGGVKKARLAEGDTPESEDRICAEYWLAGHADLVSAPAPAEALWLSEHVPGAHVKVIEPGVDLGCFNPPAPDPRTPWECEQPLNLLFAGRLQPLKAPDVAIKTLAHLQRKAHLTLVGGPSGKHGMTPEDLMALAAELGVADQVTCLPAMDRPELAEMFRKADVVLVPSHTESFGLVALEAQACATPVVASDVDGLIHVLGGHRGGILVPVNDAPGMAWAVEQICSSKAVYQAYQQRALATADRFSWQNTISRTLAAYESILKQQPVAQ